MKDTSVTLLPEPGPARDLNRIFSKNERRRLSRPSINLAAGEGSGAEARPSGRLPGRVPAESVGGGLDRTRNAGFSRVLGELWSGAERTAAERAAIERAAIERARLAAAEAARMARAEGERSKARFLYD